MFQYIKRLFKKTEWEYLGKDKYDRKGDLMLKRYVSNTLLTSLNDKARKSHGTKNVFAKGKTFIYKGIPKGDWRADHGHGERYLEIYCKKRRKN